jgi:hypothetical protein
VEQYALGTVATMLRALKEHENNEAPKSLKKIYTFQIAYNIKEL